MGELIIVEDLEHFEKCLKNEESKELILCFFTASWCGPCKAIYPTINEIAEKNDHIMVMKIDVDECEEVATECDISCMPTFKFYKNNDGVCIHTFSGNARNELVSTISNLLKEIHEQKQILDKDSSDTIQNNENKVDNNVVPDYAMPNYDPESNNKLLNN